MELESVVKIKEKYISNYFALDVSEQYTKTKFLLTSPFKAYRFRIGFMANLYTPLNTLRNDIIFMMHTRTPNTKRPVKTSVKELIVVFENQIGQPNFPMELTFKLTIIQALYTMALKLDNDYESNILLKEFDNGKAMFFKKSMLIF
jgi:hypothetical protein